MPTPITWNATRLSDEAGTRTDDFRGKWVNWLDRSAGDVWKQIDPSFEQVGNVFRADQGPWVIECPETATGSITVVNRQQFDVIEKASLNLPEMELTVTHPGARNASGMIIPGREWQVCYPDAIDDGIDIVGGIWHGRGPRAEHVYVIRTMPPGDSDYVPITCEISAPGRWLPIPNGTPWQISGGAAARMPDDERRGIYIRPTVAWYYDADGELHVVPITASVRRIVVSRTELTKYVPRALIATALAARPNGELRVDTTSTFYPDPNVETSSFDGVARRDADETWSSIRSGTGNAASDSNATRPVAQAACGTTTGNWIENWRGLFVWDTSTIGSGQTVSSATASLVFQSKYNDGGWSPTYTWFSLTTASDTAATASDYQNCGTTELATPISHASITTAGAYNDWSLSTSAVGTTTKTRLSFREAVYDAGGSTPTWSSGKFYSLTAYQADQAGTASDPKLVVTYSAASSGQPTIGRFGGCDYAANMNPVGGSGSVRIW